MMRHDAAVRFLPSPLWGGSARSAGVGVVVCGTHLASHCYPHPGAQERADPPHKGEGKSARGEAVHPC